MSDLSSSKKTNQKPLKVLFVVAEVSPYASIGGLGMAISSLSLTLKKLGLDVRIFMPKYGLINEEQYQTKMVLKGIRVPSGEEENGKKFLICNIKKHTPKKSGVPVYFLENQEYYEKRSNVYGYSDDPTRFALLCRGALEFLLQSDWLPDIINCADWHTGILPNYLKILYQNDPRISKIKTVLSIHNLYHQGVFDHRFVSELDFDDGKSPIAPFFSDKLSKQNFLKRGIIYADFINTVSETYAQEILTKDYGEGLEELLKEVRVKLTGILNGLDYQEFNPAVDKKIVSNFNASALSKRTANKIHLQKEFNLDISEEIPLLGIVGRLDEQKGLDLLFSTLEIIINEFGAQFVIVGGGEPKYRTFFEEINKKYPKNVGCHLNPDFNLARHIFAGSDIFLVPSKFEPCGIVQMEAMRYGAVPVVRKTGGLADTVKDFDPVKNCGNGFVFEKFNAYSFLGALVRALETYKHKKIWKGLVRRAMRDDFSWKASAKKYFELYKRITGA